LQVLLFPVGVVWRVFDDARFRAETRPLVTGKIEEAWERCSKVWTEVGLVCQEAPYHRSVPFAHLLAVALARQHRTQKSFFFRKLLDPDPLLAAYAFKCLIRVCKLRRETFPEEALSRSEPIKVLGGRFVNTELLGDFFKVYFLQQELEKSRRVQLS